MSGSRGQASAVAVVLVALGCAAATLLLALARVQVERARAQRGADVTALAAAAVLARGGSAADAAAAARRIARASGVQLRRLSVDGGTARVEVERPLPPLALPALVGGGSAVLHPRGRAAAAPAVGDSGAFGPRVPVRFAALLDRVARRERLSAALLAAQLEAESGFRADARSAAGALGIAQFMPATWRGSWNPWRDRPPTDPVAAINAQARYLARLLAACGGDTRKALAAYNAGLGRARLPERRWPAETRAYVARILRLSAGAGSAAGAGVALIE